jgi:hypothetical protein
LYIFSPSYLVLLYLVLFLDDLVGLRLLVGDIDTLETMDVLRQAGLGDVGLPSLHGLHQGIVDEDVLFLCLYEAVPLTSATKQINC